MRPNEVKADLAAPGNRDQVLCEKCFAFMPADAEFCAECGAPLKDAPGVAGSDAEVYPELAKANVLRMRKEFKPAEDICLAILRRYPNNVSANTLLGDIAAERGELEQAVEWYELSLDIVPDSVEVTQKLEALRQELSTRQTQATVQTLGIPQKQAPIGLYAMILLLVVAFGVAGVILSNKKSSGALEPGTDPNKPLVVGNQGQPQSEPEPKTSDLDNESKPAQYREDEGFARALAEQAGIGNRALIASIADPGGSVRLILHAVGNDGEWILKAKLVMAAFKNQSDAPKVEVQYLRADEPTPEAKIVERSAYERTQAADFDLANDALVVETLFGHKMEPPSTPQPDDTKTVTPPLGEGGSDATSEGTANPPGTSTTGG